MRERRKKSKELTRKKIKELIRKQRGLDNEQRFLEAIAVFPNKPHWWLGVREKTPEEDRRGIDAVVTADVGKLFLQIKSSLSGKRKFEKKPRKLPIAVLVVQNQDSNEIMCQKAINAIGLIRERVLMTN